ncbi:hypothetical protein [Rhizobium lusitanum]|uniref:Uncharacterized protein n=1 Tax=Rhizobium lusitanum TaxID=293958 RepID=A0A7X0IS67_9HYPH|nr:hypothetical protein [Rhizobium lusitanum]MBB6486199.1 hypothetical protein [Rhizobium lusitanum]
MIIRQIGNCRKHFALRPSGGYRRADQIAKGRMKRVLTADVPVGIVIGHEWSRNIGHD